MTEIAENYARADGAPMRSDARTGDACVPAAPLGHLLAAGAVIVATMVFGGLLGAINGVLIGYLRLRAFITTLITLIIYRSAFDLLIQHYSNAIASAFPDIPSWNFIGDGNVFGIPSVALVYIAVAIFGHIFLTRLRPGWHITAIGGSRRSAYNSGIPVRRTIALCYVASGVLTSVAGLFFAARLGTVGGDIGVGLEVIVLTATVLGGSLAPPIRRTPRSPATFSWTNSRAPRSA